MAKSRVQGVPDTVRAFKALARLVGPAANAACKRASEPILAAALQNVPVDSGELKRSLIIRRLKRSSKTKPQYRIGPKGGSPAVRYAHVTEFGRAPNADGTGEVRGTRWFTAAFEATKEAAARILRDEFGPALEAQARRVASQNAKRAVKKALGL